MKRKLILIGIFAAFSAQAQFKSGNQLLSDMQEQVGFKNGVGLGFVMGVTDAGNGTNHCPPSSATAGQISDMVQNTLTTTPAIRHLAASSIIDYVLNKTWPCKKGQVL